jgi:hypothetical protein
MAASAAFCGHALFHSELRVHFTGLQVEMEGAPFHIHAEALGCMLTRQRGHLCAMLRAQIGPFLFLLGKHNFPGQILFGPAAIDLTRDFARVAFFLRAFQTGLQPLAFLAGLDAANRFPSLGEFFPGYVKSLLTRAGVKPPRPFLMLKLFQIMRLRRASRSRCWSLYIVCRALR